jgi:hypothetical protein
MRSRGVPKVGDIGTKGFYSERTQKRQRSVKPGKEKKGIGELASRLKALAPHLLQS